MGEGGKKTRFCTLARSSAIVPFCRTCFSFPNDCSFVALSSMKWMLCGGGRLRRESRDRATRRTIAREQTKQRVPPPQRPACRSPTSSLYYYKCVYPSLFRKELERKRDRSTRSGCLRWPTKSTRTVSARDRVISKSSLP